MEQNSVFH